jgi:putative membrane protein
MIIRQKQHWFKMMLVWHGSVLPKLLPIALALFLGFRNSASYDRFWEGRKLWGALLNTSRSLALQALTLIDPLDENAPLTTPDPANAQGRTLLSIIPSPWSEKRSRH